MLAQATIQVLDQIEEELIDARGGSSLIFLKNFSLFTDPRA